MDFIEKLIDEGGEVYKVGGSVRNLIYNNIHNTNKPTKDYDVLIRLLPMDKIIELLKIYGFVKVVGLRFGVIKFKEDIKFKDNTTNLSILNSVTQNELDIA